MRAPPSPPALGTHMDSGYNSESGIETKERFSTLDSRIIGYEPLIQPALLTQELPSSNFSKTTIKVARENAAKILSGIDDRLVVVVGPCSIHDPAAAFEYANLLRRAWKGEDGSAGWPELIIIMRCYFEKPRTTVGWKGLVNDPNLDGSFKINKGLRIARQLLTDITHIGMPVGLELLDTISPQYFSDLLSWGAIGARTTESQLHRELASGVSFPVGFKNGTDGSVTVAIDAMFSASSAHSFLGVTQNGIASIVKTRGNDDVHIILRGGNKGPNYGASAVQDVVAAVHARNPEKMASIMIDCSHGNSQKNHLNQALVVQSICSQLENGDRHITGVMIESNLNGGRQDVPQRGSKTDLKYGVSITDACVDWETTVDMLGRLNTAVAERRKVVAGTKTYSACTDDRM
ncbi:3-deoxy-7-phosphoheptulonate synthase [Mycena sp. CBHHK59/15]|nr:3-deoxy-7-phosphoheptulonate synthase [Mycena sp. CBHHK59/15]